jgi:hypothetical protein
MSVTRRDLLRGCVGAGLGTIGLVLAGCDDDDAPLAVDPTRGGPDGAALQAAYDSERRIVDSLAGLAPTATDATVGIQHATHVVHLAALAKALGVASASSSAPPAAALAPLLGRRELERTVEQSSRVLRAAAVQAVDGTTAAVLASVAGAHLAETAARR